MTVSQTNNGCRLFPHPALLAYVTKDSMIIELVYINLINIDSKVTFFTGGAGEGSRGWALILGWAFNRINTVTYFV